MKLAPRALLFASLSPLALSAPAMAQDQPPAPGPQAQAGNPDEQAIIVTGTRRSDRTVADSPVPVDVIGSEAISNSGQTETNKILNQLVPSFNFPQPSIADGSDTLRPATLRGLSPDQTLVLVNGKRRHVSAFSTSTAPWAAAAPRSTSTSFPASPSAASKCCATALPPNMARTRSPASSTSSSRSADHGGKASLTYGEYRTTINNVAKVTGLQLNGGGQPQLDPTDPRYFLADTDGERRAHDGTQCDVRRSISASRSVRTVSSISPASIAIATRPTAPATT